MSESLSASLEREIGKLLEAAEQNKRGQVALAAQLDLMRQENEAAHARVDDRIIKLNEDVAALRQRIDNSDARQRSANNWLIAVAGIIATIGMASIGGGFVLNSEVAGLLTHTTDLAAEVIATHQEQQINNASVRRDITQMSGTISTISAQLSDLQRCIAKKRGC